MEKTGPTEFLLRVNSGEQEWSYVVRSKQFILGRSPDVEVHVPLDALSRKHLSFEQDIDGKWYFWDLGSSNGTFFENKKLLPQEKKVFSKKLHFQVGLNTNISLELTENSATEATLLENDPVEFELPMAQSLEKAEKSNSNKQTENSHSEELIAVLVESREVLEKTKRETATLIAAQESLLSKISLLKSEEDKVKDQIRIQNKILDDAVAKEHHALEQEQTIEERINLLIQNYEDLKNQEEKQLQSLKSLEQQFIEAHKQTETCSETLLKTETAVLEKQNKLNEIDEKLDIQGKTLLDLQNTILEQNKSLQAAIELESAAKQQEELSRERAHLSIQKYEELKPQEEALLLKLKQLELIFAETQRKNVLLLEELQKTEAKLGDKQKDLIEIDEKIKNKEKINNELQNAILDQNKSLQAAIESESGARKREDKILEGLKQLQAELLDHKTQSAKAESERVLIEATHLRLLQAKKEKEFEILEKDKTLNVLSQELLKQSQTLEHTHSQMKHKLSQIEESEGELRAKTEKLKEIDNKVEARTLELKSIEEHLSQKEALKNEFAKQEDLQKTKLQEAFLAQVKKQDGELANLKHEALKSIEAEKLAWKRNVEKRRPHEMKEILRVTNALFSAYFEGPAKDKDQNINSSKSGFFKDFSSALASVLNDTGADPNAGNTYTLAHAPSAESQNARKFWMTRAAQAGAGLSLLLLFLLVPQIPQKIGATFSGIMSRNPASNSFVEQVRLNRSLRPKFLPTQDSVYRASYADNLIYRIGYEELKTNEDIGKEWILSLNKYFLEELKLNDRIIVEFISIEGPLISELIKLKSQIKPETQEQDIKKMSDFENQQKARFLRLLGGETNFQSVRSFERSFISKKLQ